MAAFVNDEATSPWATDYRLSTEGPMPIAVVGMSFRGPGDATSVENLWKMIIERRDGRCEIPKDRWNNEAFYHPDPNRHGAHNVTAGHFMRQDQRKFDAPFFNLTAAEAAALDPVQRLMLEASFEATENAGVPLENFCGSETSVFGGAFSTDYTNMLSNDPESLPMYQCTNAGFCRSNIANRLSYFYDLKGASVAIDTACSTSLVALHLGCQSLWTGDATMSLVAGASVFLGPEIMMTMSMMRMLSPDGRCYTFDSRANGYARGEGVGCLLLKPLQDAVRDGDTVRAIIRGTGSNQDGRTQGITMPSVVQQERLMRRVYANARIDPAETDFVECHGTGTPAGDPLEAEAISRVFCEHRERQNPLRIGSVKTNVGHLEGASGVTGVIKAILSLEAELFLPNVNFETPNERIRFDDWKLTVPTSVQTWKKGVAPRRASVNSFGYGGSNAHVILESAKDHLEGWGYTSVFRTTRSKLPSLLAESIPEETNGDVLQNGTHHVNGDIITNGFHESNGEAVCRANPSPPRLFLLSGLDETVANQQVERLKYFIGQRIEIADDQYLCDLAYTLGERRTTHLLKAVIQARTIDDLVKATNEGIAFSRSPGKQQATLGFVFTGQGAQWAGMGYELIALYPIFRASLSTSSEMLNRAGASFDLVVEMTKIKDSQINRAVLSQPLCTGLQIALVDLLASWDIRPSSVTGHSSGEIAAAYAAGVLNHEDAMLLAYQRGRCCAILAEQTPGRGSMLAVGMSKDDALPVIAGLIGGKAVVACSNSPSSITVSGDVAAIEELQFVLTEMNIFNRRLVVEVAYHSHHMVDIADEYRAAISGIEVRDASAYFFSSVNGERSAGSALGPDYWVSNLLSEVKFSQSLRLMCSETGQAKKGRRHGATLDALIEIGPHSGLAGPVRQTLESDDKLRKASIPYHATLTRKKDAADCMLELASSLFLAGIPIALDNINRPTCSSIPSLLVDLPPYPWNHSKEYWVEPRLSKAWLHRQHPKTDLLGVLDQHSSSLEPRWRNIIRLSELPWLRDHVIQSNIVFPGAGYIVMAVESALQRAKHRDVTSVTGFKIREVIIGSALVIPEDTGQVEIAVTLKSYSESMRLPSDVWDEFLVTSVSEDDRWTEHCRGLISVQTPPKLRNVVNGDSYEQVEGENYEILAAQYDRQDTKDIDVPRFYHKLTELGLEYGETFAMMTEARSAPGSCLARFRIPDTAATMPMNYQSQFVVHPATIDALFHSIFAALSTQRGGLQSPAVPVSIDEITISSDIINEPGEELVAYTTTTDKGHRFTSADLYVFQDRDKKSVINIGGITCAILDLVPDPVGDAPHKAYNFSWQPDVDMLSPMQVAALCQHEELKEEMTSRPKLEQAVIDSIALATGSMSSDYQQRLRALSEIIRAQSCGHRSNRTAEDDHACDALLADHEKSSAAGSPLCGVASQPSLHANGETKPSDLPKALDLSALFEVFATVQGHESAAAYINLLSHKKPGLSILIVGSGSGLSTIALLTALAEIQGDVFAISTLSYADTDFDISGMLKAKSPTWAGLVHKQELDVFANVLPQDEDLRPHDVILACCHPATPDTGLKTLLANSRKLLNVDGHLLLADLSKMPLIRNIVFVYRSGFLDVSSTVSAECARAHELIQHTGFAELASLESGSLTVLQSSTDELQLFPEVSVLLVTETCDLQIAVQALLDLPSVRLVNVQTTTLDAAYPMPDQVSIVLSDITDDTLLNPSAAHFGSLKRIMLQSAGVLWVSRGATCPATNPNKNIAIGLARTVRSETGTIPIVSLDLNAEKPLSEIDAAKIVFSVFKKHFLVPDRKPELETEYAERDGVLYIPRLVEDTECRTALAYPDHREPEMQPFWQEGRALSLKVGKPGLLNTIHFADDKRGDRLLPSDYVDIEVRATGLNFKDVMMAMGQIKFEPLGLECSGIITAVGDDAQDFMVGDRVVCYGDGAFCTKFRTPAARVQKIPDAMDFETAAAIPIAYTTAYYAIHHLARLRKGESMLVHAATGGLGQALIEFGQLIEAEIFATVGSLEKKALLMEQFRIPEDHIFFSRDGSYAEGVKRMTAGKGVDVIMNSLASEGLRLTWDCIASLGRFIELGMRDVTVNSRLEMAPFIKNASFHLFNLVYFLTHRPVAANRAFADVISMFRVGALHGPRPLHVWSIQDIEKAFRTMQSGSHMGKLVAIPKQGAMVPVAPQDKSKNLLRPDVSYLLSGGLGGIGRATAQWMVEHGARNIIFVNRSGETGKDAKETVRLLRAQGSNVSVTCCDISDAPSVQDLAEQLKASMPPIKGVIQGAMVLHDGLFEKMLLEDWQAVSRCKVQGTWNLHNFLSTDVDFFIMEASVSGIVGNATQACYAAANTFLDAFAAFRNSQGLPATTIDLGAIGGVGFLSGKDDLRTAMERQGFDIIDEKTLMKIIQFAIENPRRKIEMSQIVTGLGTYREGSSLSALTLPIFSRMRFLSTPDAQSGRSSSTKSLRSTLQSAESLDDASKIICTALINKLAERSGVSPESINVTNSLADYGVDSLSAVETRNWIMSTMASTVSILEMLGNNSLMGLATKIAQRSRFVVLQSKQNP